MDNKDRGGFIWVPWIMETHTKESQGEYDKFMNDYQENHLYCPKCGYDYYESTLVGYVLVRGKENEYKDLNKCKCSKCGDKHTKHDRVNIEKTRNLTINNIIK